MLHKNLIYKDMKNIYSLSLFVLVTSLFTACETDSAGVSHLTGFGWFFIFISIIGIVVTIITSNESAKKNSERMKESRVSLDIFIRMDLYVCGHPMIDYQIKNSCIFKRDADLVICNYDTIISSFDAKSRSRRS